MTNLTLPGIGAERPLRPEHAEYKALLVQARKSKGMPATGLAKLAGISNQYLNDIEAGKRVPLPEVVGRLCDALEVPQDDREYWVLCADWARVPESWREEIKRLRWLLNAAGGKFDG